MAHAINRYKADLREFQFVLFEQFRLHEVLTKEPFADWGRDECTTVLSEAYRFSCEVLGPTNSIGDTEGCRVENGGVKVPAVFHDAWKKLAESGWKLLGVEPELGGQGAPLALRALVEEMLNGANVAFATYPGLAAGAAEVIAQCGTEKQRHTYVEKMLNGTWGGTMCLTEPHAGSDVGMARTTAKKNADGSYNIRGAKIFITGGDQDITDNVVHLVLARVDGAPAGTKGLSLFIVSKKRIAEDGSPGDSNDVSVAAIEHKMGINGSATCQLNFGENDQCVGELVGTVENQGMQQMFRLMNSARIATGLQGLSLASSAFLNALEYAKDRKQGASIVQWKDPTAPRVPIIQHPDVRRMLLDMKSRVEGIRALIIKLATHMDRANSLGGTDDDKKAYHIGQVDLLVPLVKAYGSDQAFRVCETAIQTYGGAGYLKDWPVEQYCRDSKIFSIYEGTNHIQSMDLIGRKLGQNGGANMQAFLGDVATFVAENKSHPVLGAAVEDLAKAHEALGGTTMRLLGWFQSGQVPMVPLVSTRFLEMMSETVVGWLLLDGAKVALDAAAKLPEGHKDRAFYEGKKAAAIYYARNVVPGVVAKAEIIAAADDSALNISDEAFATI